jgi:hypothetical protein
VIQTPRGEQGGSDLGLYVTLAFLWIVPGLVFALSAILAGGQPHTHVIDWPYFAIRDLVHNRNGVAPWQWVGADTVRSSIVFWAVAVFVTVPLLAGILLLFVVLRGGIPAFFPFLSQPAIRSRWAARGALNRAGLLMSGPDGRRLVLGRHLDAWVAVREGVSVLALGAAGSGKSSGLCIPAIGEWEGTVVAVSDRTDLVEMTAGLRQHLGRVDVLDAGGHSGLATCTWSSGGVRLSFDEAVAVVEGILGSRDPAPDESTRQVLTCALYGAANRGVGVGGAVEWLDDVTGATLVRSLLQVPDRDPRATSWATRIVERDRDARAASFSAARQLLRAHFEQAAPSVGTHAFQPTAFLSGAANTLYVLTAGGAPFASPVDSLLSTLIAEAGQHRRRRALLVVLDGCAAVASMRDLAERLATRDGTVTVLAAVGDLDDCGAQAEWNMAALADRARAVLLLGGGGDSGPTELMHRLVRRQLAPRGRRRARQDEWRPDLLPPEAARHLGQGRALLVHEKMAPAVVWIRNCYEDPELQARQREHPYVRGVTHIDRAS